MLIHSISFNVKGITLNNEEKKDIQKEIKRILKQYKDNDYFGELFGGYTNKEIKEMDLNVSEYEGYSFPAKLVGDEYAGKECLKIYLKTFDNKYVHIGYAPKENLSEITEWINKEGIKVEGKIEITGGKYKYSELYEEDYEEKERICTKTLIYGAEVTLNFYNNEIDYEKQKKEEKLRRDIERQKMIPYLVIAIICLPVIWIFFKIISFFTSIFN